MQNHPRFRQRVETIHVQYSPQLNLSNEKLLEMYARSKKDKRAETTINAYASIIRDAIKFNSDPYTGREVPFREWNKETIWGYLLYCEANYCASFHPAPFGREGAVCKMNVWMNVKSFQQATAEHCKDCTLFKTPTLDRRVNALSSLFKYLTKIGVIRYNFCRDVVDEYWEEHADAPSYERRRNPTLDETRKLVNGTLHPRNRFVYAVSAKWWIRTNELFRLDRYASFGLPMPEGHRLPLGFGPGFPTHSYLPSYEDGGDLAYIPMRIGENGAELPDKRRGNRWLVIDSELRPILDEYFAWWERVVRRDENGIPTTTALILTDGGSAMEQDKMYDVLFYDDCERLGLMQPGDRKNPLRAWTFYCGRHTGERENQLADHGWDWKHHFRGDKLPGARRHYFYPKPEEVREMYLKHVRKIGLRPLPERTQLAPRSERLTETAKHRLVLQGVIERTEAKNRLVRVKCMEIVEVEQGRDVNVTLAPIQVAASVLYAHKIGNPTKTFLVRIHEETRDRPRPLAKSILLATYRKALEYLGGPDEAPLRAARAAPMGTAGSVA